MERKVVTTVQIGNLNEEELELIREIVCSRAKAREIILKKEEEEHE